jgi:CDP-glucose 4,6-dehydratase
MSRAVLVTGATGLVGRWLVPALLERGDRVVALVRGDGALDPRAEVVRGDLLDDAALHGAFAAAPIDTVFHLAGTATAGAAARSPDAAWTANVRGTQRVLDAACAAGAAHVVVASSIRAYGAGGARGEDAPLAAEDPYGASKAAADVLARSATGVAVAVVRAGNLYGTGDRQRSRLVPEAIAAALAGRPPVLRSDGTPRRDLLHAQDAAAAYLAVADALARGAAAGEAFDVGAGETHAVGDVAATIVRLAGSDAMPVLGAEGGADDAPVAAVKLRTLTGWAPRVSLADGLARTIADARALAVR